MMMNPRLLIVPACALLVLWGLACAQTQEGAGENEGARLPDDIPSLVELLGQPQQPNQNEIIRKLAERGEEAVPALIEAMAQGGETQNGAVHVLARIGAPAVPGLIDALGSGDYMVRYGAISALGEIGPAASDAVDPLKGMFARTTKNEQVLIMYSLLKISPNENIVTMLKAALMVDDLRWDAMRVLGQIGSPASSAVPSLLPYLVDENSQTRIETTMSLEGIGQAENVVDEIAKLLTDADVRVRTQAATTLGTFGSGAASTTQALASALNDTEAEVQRCVAKSLGMIAPASSAAIPALIGALEATDPQVRREAAWALGQFGPAASSALPALRQVAESDEFDYVRTAASESIAAIEGGSAEESE